MKECEGRQLGEIFDTAIESKDEKLLIIMLISFYTHPKMTLGDMEALARVGMLFYDGINLPGSRIPTSLLIPTVMHILYTITRAKFEKNVEFYRLLNGDKDAGERFGRQDRPSVESN